MLQTTSSENYESHNWLLNWELAHIQAYKLTMYLCTQTSKKNQQNRNQKHPNNSPFVLNFEVLQINPDSSRK